jgi:AcrR family transcriptional regulator
MSVTWNFPNIPESVDTVYRSVDNVYMAGSPRRNPRERLIETALDVVAQEGLEGLSLRNIARRAGVSHGAPLRHFASLGDLLAEVAAVGFRMLSEAIEKSAAQIAPGAGPLARLRAGSRAYVECAVATPALFGLMFRPELLDPDNASFRRDGGAAFEHVVVQVRAAQDAGWHPQRDTRLLAGAVWASLHGLATLWAQGAFSGAVPRASLEDALTTALELLLDGAPGGTR